MEQIECLAQLHVTKATSLLPPLSKIVVGYLHVIESIDLAQCLEGIVVALGKPGFLLSKEKQCALEEFPGLFSNVLREQKCRFNTREFQRRVQESQEFCKADHMVQHWFRSVRFIDKHTYMLGMFSLTVIYRSCHYEMTLYRNMNYHPNGNPKTLEWIQCISNSGTFDETIDEFKHKIYVTRCPEDINIDQWNFFLPLVLSCIPLIDFGFDKSSKHL